MANATAYVPGFKCPDDNITFGSAIGAAPTGTAEDNDTFVVTDTGDATGTPLEIYKFDKETGTWVSVDLDTDVSAINAALSGTNLTVAITEDGNTLTSTADLAALLDDTDVSDVRILAGATSTPAKPTIQFGVTEDGVEVLSNEWPLAPICPDEMTRNAAIALRNAGNLIPGCHYIITDPSANGTLQLEKVLMHALDANTLSGCYLKVAHDNTAWNGSYDIDTNRVEDVHSHLRNNRVKGNNAIIVFPWGDGNWFENTIDDAGTLSVSGGVMNRSYIGANGSLTIAAGFVQGSSIESGSLNIQGGRFDNSSIHGTSNIRVSDTADVQSSHFQGQAALVASGNANIDFLSMDGSAQSTLSGGTIARTSVESEATLNVSGGTVNETELSTHAQLVVSGGTTYRNRLSSEASVTVPGGQFFENEVTSNSSVNLVGQGRFFRNTVDTESNLTIGGHDVFECQFERCQMNTTGSAGDGLRYQAMGRGFVDAQNVANIFWQSGSFSGYYEIRVTGAAEVQLNQVNMSSYGRILASAGARIQSNQTGVRDYGYIQSTGAGLLQVNSSTISALSYIFSQSPNPNYVERCSVTGSSRIRFLNTVNNCRIYYCDVTSGSYIEHRGTSSDCYWYYCSATSFSEIYSNNSVSLRGYYNAVSGNSRIYSINVTGTHYIYYTVCDAHGYMHFENAPGGRVYAVHCSGQGLVRFRPAGDAGRLFYSSFHAYYYLYADAWTATSQGLHGYGRRSYTVTNPPNGTFTQNF